MPWTKGKGQTWNIASDKGQALYWEWKPDLKSFGPEDFLVFVRTLFPNGGFVCRTQSNDSLIWTIVEGDIYGVGLRKLHSVWIVAILECSEVYPGASVCPDRILSLKANRFVAEEFLRGTNPLEIYKADPCLTVENESWWEYLERLQKVVCWKFPEVQIFKRRAGHTHSDSLADAPRNSKEKLGSSYRETDVKSWRSSYERRYEHEDQWRRKSDDGYRSTGRPVRRRSRSPPKQLESQSLTHLDGKGESSNKKRELSCKTCDVTFEHSYELMRHYNTEGHLNALSREFHI